MTTTTPPKKHRAGTARLAVLAAMPGTQTEIRAKSSASIAGVSRWCDYLVKCGDAHVGAWTLSAVNIPMPIYHPGPGVNVKNPYPKRTQKQRDRDSRRRRRKSGEWEDRKARERAYYWRDKAPRRDPLTAALFGPATTGVTAH